MEQAQAEPGAGQVLMSVRVGVAGLQVPVLQRLEGGVLILVPLQPLDGVVLPVPVRVVAVGEQLAMLALVGGAPISSLAAGMFSYACKLIRCDLRSFYIFLSIA